MSTKKTRSKASGRSESNVMRCRACGCGSVLAHLGDHKAPRAPMLWPERNPGQKRCERTRAADDPACAGHLASKGQREWYQRRTSDSCGGMRKTMIVAAVSLARSCFFLAARCNRDMPAGPRSAPPMNYLGKKHDRVAAARPNEDLGSGRDRRWRIGQGDGQSQALTPIAHTSLSLPGSASLAQGRHRRVTFVQSADLQSWVKEESNAMAAVETAEALGGGAVTRRLGPTTDRADRRRAV
jgi:hypothetical protein